MIVIIPFACLLVFWIYAELRLKILARIASGLACAIYAIYCAYVLASIVPGFERDFTKRSMVLCEEALTNGNPQTALQAVHIYNTVAATGNTYQASVQMFHALASVRNP